MILLAPLLHLLQKEIGSLAFKMIKIFQYSDFIQDTEVGSQIMRVSATDVDEGDNQKITYELRAEKYPADIEYFRYDEKTGEVWLSKKLDKPVSSVFVLKVSRQCQLQGRKGNLTRVK